MDLCDLPEFVVNHYNQGERCSFALHDVTPTPRLVFVAMGAEVLTLVVLCFVLWRTLYGSDRHFGAWWWLLGAIFLFATVATKLTACL